MSQRNTLKKRASQSGDGADFSTYSARLHWCTERNNRNAESNPKGLIWYAVDPAPRGGSGIGGMDPREINPNDQEACRRKLEKMIGRDDPKLFSDIMNEWRRRFGNHPVSRAA